MLPCARTRLAPPPRARSRPTGSNRPRRARSLPARRTTTRTVLFIPWASGWEDTRLADATRRLPGFGNAHRHALPRALRGRVGHVDPDPPHDALWTWRAAMY